MPNGKGRKGGANPRAARNSPDGVRHPTGIWLTMPDRRGLLPCVRPGLARNSRPRPGPQAWRQTAGPARTFRPFGQTDRHRPVSAPAPPRQWGFSGSGASPVAGLARSSRRDIPQGSPVRGDRAASGTPPRNRLRPARPHATARLNGIPPTWPETSAKPSGSRSETMIPRVWKVGKKLWNFFVGGGDSSVPCPPPCPA